MQFFGNVVFLQDISIKNEKIAVICNWPKPQSVRDIKLFLEFANFQ